MAKRLEPEDVLQKQLEHLHETAVDQALAIAGKLKEEGQGVFLAQLYHDAIATRKQLLEIAKALIPYRAPRLESVEMKQVIEHKFAVFSPEPIQKIEDFMKTIGKEELPPVVTRNANKVIDYVPEVLDTASRVVDTTQGEEHAIRHEDENGMEVPDEMYIMEP